MACISGRSYQIQPNDRLYDIAQRELGNGNRWTEIRKPDGTPFTESEARNLAAGDEICLPTTPAPAPTSIPMPAPAPTPETVFVGFFESWLEQWETDPARLKLSNIAAYVNQVIVSFMMPNATYIPGSYELGRKDHGTGLEFPEIDSLGQKHHQIRDAIALLKHKNPGTQVLISVGGDSYSKPGYFEALNPTAIAAVVTDFGFDGVDICFEPYRYFDPPSNARCTTDAQGHISCTTDSLFQTTIQQIRAVLPRPQLLTLSAWSIGAYGEGPWQTAEPAGLPLTGLMLNVLRSPEAALIDQLNVMSYSAGHKYDPRETLAAYQHYFPKRITMGLHVPPEPYAPPGTDLYVYTLTKVRQLTQAVIDRQATGMMLWSLQDKPEEAVTEENPSPEMMAQTVCQMLSLGDENQPLFSV